MARSFNPFSTANVKKPTSSQQSHYKNLSPKLEAECEGDEAVIGGAEATSASPEVDGDLLARYSTIVIGFIWINKLFISTGVCAGLAV